MENSGLIVMACVCVLWPLLWAAAAWHLRGALERYAAARGEMTLWEAFTRGK